MTHLTGICIHCGKKKEEHIPSIWEGELLYCSADPDTVRFHDSGQARLEDNAEELLRAASEVCELPKEVTIKTNGPYIKVHIDQFTELQNVISKIYGK